jgi:hypothetical protein
LAREGVWIDLPHLSDEVAGGSEREIELVDRQLLELVERARFSPVVSFGESGRVSVWLPELAIYGQGDTFEDAASDLVDEVMAYVEEWKREIGGAPNHATKFPYLRRIEIAGTAEKVRALLFAKPQ